MYCMQHAGPRQRPSSNSPGYIRRPKNNTMIIIIIAPGRPARHHALNDLVARAMVFAGIPLGLSRPDGKRPGGLSLVPCEAGKPLTWDVTVICPLADSYVAAAAREAGLAAEEAATRKTAKYSNIQAHHIFSQLPLSHWVQSMRRVVSSFRNSVASLLSSRATTEKSAFYFSDSPF